MHQTGRRNQQVGIATETSERLEMKTSERLEMEDAQPLPASQLKPVAGLVSRNPLGTLPFDLVCRGIGWGITIQG